MLRIGTVVLGVGDIRRASEFWREARPQFDNAAEVSRLVSLGAQRVDWDLYPKSPDFIVLADTEGNRFCVVNKGYE